jgi:hypothetical protein
MSDGLEEMQAAAEMLEEMDPANMTDLQLRMAPAIYGHADSIRRDVEQVWKEEVKPAFARFLERAKHADRDIVVDSADGPRRWYLKTVKKKSLRDDQATLGGLLERCLAATEGDLEAAAGMLRAMLSSVGTNREPSLRGSRCWLSSRSL